MNTGFLPDPLHPAVVHFPIVLILIGMVASLIAAITARKAFVIATAIFLVAAAGSAWVALATGDAAEEALPALDDGSVRRYIHEHEEAAEVTAWLASSAAGFSLVAWFFMVRGRTPIFPAILRVLVFLLALCAAGSVAITGKRGGALVYEYGLGVKIPGISASPEHPAQPPHDDDD